MQVGGSATRIPPMTLPPGTRLGPYEIVATLGAGGMGEVYRARDARLGREVALKALPSEVATSPSTACAASSRRRARPRRFSSESLLTVFDIGEQDGVRFLVTELLEGETLRDLLERGPTSAAKALELTAQFARGLAAAHERGIVHRDLKPEEPLPHPRRPRQDPRLRPRQGAGADRPAGARHRRRFPDPAPAAPAAPAGRRQETAPGLVFGTVAYMSPGKVRGRPADARSDLFSLGVVLLEMLTGRPPFRRDSAAETMAAILKEEPPRLSTAGVQLPPAPRARARRATADRQAPAERYPTARALLADLEGPAAAHGSNVFGTSGISGGASAAQPLRRFRQLRWLGWLGWLGWLRHPPGGRAAVDRRAAVRRHEPGARPGLLLRRHGRGAHPRPRAAPRPARRLAHRRLPVQRARRRHARGR